MLLSIDIVTNDSGIVHLLSFHALDDYTEEESKNILCFLFLSPVSSSMYLLSNSKMSSRTILRIFGRIFILSWQNAKRTWCMSCCSLLLLVATTRLWTVRLLRFISTRPLMLSVFITFQNPIDKYFMISFGDCLVSATNHLQTLLLHPSSNLYLYQPHLHSNAVCFSNFLDPISIQAKWAELYSRTYWRVGLWPKGQWSNPHFHSIKEISKLPLRGEQYAKLSLCSIE